MNLHNLYYVYRVHPHGTDDLHHQLVGKFILTPNHFEVLEDNSGQFKKLEGKPPAQIAAYIHKLSDSMYFKLVNLQDLIDGKHHEFIKPYEPPPDLGPESVFEYHRVGMPEAQVLEFHSGKAYLDGHLLGDQDLQLLLDNAQQGHATIRYKQAQESVEKSEEFFMSLAKVEPHLDQALSGLREAVKAGHVDPKVLKTLTGEIFTDSMVRSMGNKKAFSDFLSRPKQGIHIRMDGNDFGSINKLHGFETGNQAIVAMGNAIREAMDEAVGRKHGKLFRIGGDEFHAFVPNHEHAAQFARAVRQKLEAIPAVGGTHSLSLSLGFGHTPDHAELALINAKGEKKKAGYAAGTAKTHAASQVPGFEGIIPTGQDQLKLKPIPQMHPQTAAEAIQHLPEKAPTVASPGPFAPTKPATPPKS